MSPIFSHCPPPSLALAEYAVTLPDLVLELSCPLMGFQV